MHKYIVGILIGVGVIGSSGILAYQIFTPSSGLIPPLERGDGLGSLAPQDAEQVSEFDLQNLKTADGLTYAEVRTAFDRIEAVHKMGFSDKGMHSQNAIPDMYVTNVETKQSIIIRYHEAPTTRCSDGACPEIPLYRLNQQTGAYDRIVDDLRHLPGYRQYVDSRFDSKDLDLKGEGSDEYRPQRIFTWSDNGRYVFFTNLRNEEQSESGDLYLDTKNLAEGFKKLGSSFADWISNQDKTKSISLPLYQTGVGNIKTPVTVQQFEALKGKVEWPYSAYVVDFNTLKVTPLFEALPEGKRLFLYPTFGLDLALWPYIRWIDTKTIEYYTMPKKVVDAGNTCSELDDVEKVESCFDTLLKENFSLLERHEFSVK